MSIATLCLIMITALVIGFAIGVITRPAKTNIMEEHPMRRKEDFEDNNDEEDNNEHI